jgi:hypothetical protein
MDCDSQRFHNHTLVQAEEIWELVAKIFWHGFVFREHSVRIWRRSSKGHSGAEIVSTGFAARASPARMAWLNGNRSPTLRDDTAKPTLWIVPDASWPMMRGREGSTLATIPPWDQKCT